MSIDKRSSRKLHAGEEVELRSENEILQTLDASGRLEGLPFMPEMRKYLGKRLRVLKRLDKIIVEGYGPRRIRNTVILARTTCDGEMHGKCRRTCLFLWKEAWLRRTSVCPEKIQIEEETGFERKSALAEGVSSCQSASLLSATTILSKWDLRQYLWDIESGAYGPLERLHSILMSLSLTIQKLVLGKTLISHGKLRRTPEASLGVLPGERVEVKREREILATLDAKGRNRGLEFTQEMRKYCGKRFQVLKRIDKMIDEKTGKMRQIANTVLLEDVTCDGKGHGGCPRTCYCLWREIWLRRVDESSKTYSARAIRFLGAPFLVGRK